MMHQSRKERLYRRLRRREPLSAEGSGMPLMRGDSQLYEGWQRGTGKRDRKAASVLIPIVVGRPDPAILLTKRTEDLAAHAGQVSFPGGRREPQDKDHLATALRETEEEIGLDSQHVSIIGKLHTYNTVTQYEIVPFVGIVDDGFELRIDPMEVESVFELPLSRLLEGKGLQIESREWRGEERFFYAMSHQDYYIWGATAAMLVNLSHVLRLYAAESAGTERSER